MDKFARFFGGIYDREPNDRVALAERHEPSAKTPTGETPALTRLEGLRSEFERELAGGREDVPAGGVGGPARHAFMAFWYAYARMLTAIWPSITVRGERLVVFPNVYKPLENEHVSSDYCRPGDRVLDLGCGSGVGAVFCAPVAREVVAVDISATAVRNTAENCRLRGLRNVKVLRSDMFSAVEGRFDLIIANCPYIEDEFAIEEQQFATSVRYMPTLFAQAGDHLAPKGRLLLQFPLKGEARIEKLAERHGLRIVFVQQLPRKSLRLSLLSLAYMEVGFRSALFMLQRATDASDDTAPKQLAA